MKIAVWGHPYLEFPEGEDSLREIKERLGTLREAGISVYIPFVVYRGRTYFASKTVGLPERELLGPVMEAAGGLGIEVHPVLGLGDVGVPVPEGRRYAPGEDAAAMPEGFRSWPCASWGENHEITVRVAQDLIANYSPAGIHLDYVRYPNASHLAEHPCRCERCCEVRLQWLGKPVPDPPDLRVPGIIYKEIQMRVEFVRSLVESMRGLTDQHSIALSAAVRARYYQDAIYEGQDWAEWCQDGLLDFVCPMSYNPCFSRFARFIGQHRRLVAGTGAEWLAGIGRKSSLGELTADEMSRQIRFAEQAGADGVCIFHARALGEEDLSLLREMTARP